VLVDDRPPKGKAADIQAAYANKNKEVVSLPKERLTNEEVVKDAATAGELRLIDGYAADGSGRKFRIWDPAQPVIERINSWNDAVVHGRVPDDEAYLRSETGRE
jgi:hypothetical protein